MKEIASAPAKPAQWPRAAQIVKTKAFFSPALKYGQ